jgi:integrase
VPWLDKLKAPAQREDYRDRSTKGLQLRVGTTGVRSFSYVYRIGRKMGRVSLGKYPDFSLKAARDKTNEYRRLVALGVDPRSEKNEKIKKEQMTVGLMVEEFIEKYAKPKNSSWKQAESNLRLYLISALGKKPIHEVTRPDIHQILDDLVGRGKHTAANRALAHTRKFFGWLVERGYLDYSPAAYIKPRHQEQEREKVLTEGEIRAIWIASEAMSGPYSAWIKLLLLCGQRRLETASLRRSQIIDNCWHLSGADTKNKQLHIVPLSKQAMALVERLLKQDGEFLIKTGRTGDKPVNGFSKAKAQLDRLSGVQDWKFHDIRRTVATNLSKLGVDRFLLQRIVNHTDSGVTAIYDRYSYLEEKREALQRWADRLDDIIG